MGFLFLVLESFLESSKKWISLAVIIKGIASGRPQVYFQRRASLNLWEIPGGKIESGETAEQAAARELEEECEISITPARFRLFGRYGHQYSDDQAHKDKKVELFVCTVFLQPEEEDLFAINCNEEQKWVDFWSERQPEKILPEIWEQTFAANYPIYKDLDTYLKSVVEWLERSDVPSKTTKEQKLCFL